MKSFARHQIATTRRQCMWETGLDGSEKNSTKGKTYNGLWRTIIHSCNHVYRGRPGNLDQKNVNKKEKHIFPQFSYKTSSVDTSELLITHTNDFNNHLSFYLKHNLKPWVPRSHWFLKENKMSPISRKEKPSLHRQTQTPRLAKKRS